jgi:hypothetical protein
MSRKQNKSSKIRTTNLNTHTNRSGTLTPMAELCVETRKSYCHLMDAALNRHAQGWMSEPSRTTFCLRAEMDGTANMEITLHTIIVSSIEVMWITNELFLMIRTSCYGNSKCYTLHNVWVNFINILKL